MENATFTYNYSAKRNSEVESIRERYLPKAESKLDRLKRLDKRVRAAGQIESLSLGIVGLLLFGIGMCFGLDALSGADWLTPVFLLAGILVMLPAYPVYKLIYKREYDRLSPEILALSDEIMNEKA